MLAATATARMSRNNLSIALARARAVAVHMSTVAAPLLDQVLALRAPAFFAHLIHPSRSSSSQMDVLAPTSSIELKN